MTRLGMITFLSTWIRKSTQFVVSRSILFLPSYTQGEKKNFGSEQESNPGPLVSRATALTMAPWPPLGLFEHLGFISLQVAALVKGLA